MESASGEMGESALRAAWCMMDESDSTAVEASEATANDADMANEHFDGQSERLE